MGNILAQLFRTLFGRKEMRVVMVGLDAAGKTTILYKLKLGEVVATIPTIGFNVETVVHKNVSFTVWDLCSQDKIRPLWKHYFHDARHVAFVVDSNDRERIGEVREELNRLLGEEELRDAALLVLANKQDVPSAMDAAEIADRLGLPSLQDRNWHVQAASAVTGDGLYEGLDWLANPLPGRKPAHRPPSTASQTEDTSVATGLPLEGGGALETTEGEGAAVGSARILPITDKRHSENKT